MTTPGTVERYDLNDLVTLVATVLGTDGVTPAQPSYFAFLVKANDGTVATYVFGAAGASVLNPAAGAFTKDITVGGVGSWYYRSVATGLVQSNEEWGFLVDSSFIL